MRKISVVSKWETMWYPCYTFIYTKRDGIAAFVPDCKNLLGGGG